MAKKDSEGGSAAEGATEEVVEWAQDDQKKFIFGHFFVDLCLKNVKIPTCLPASKHKPPAVDRYSGEPHVFVSADTHQKASFVNIEVEDPAFLGRNHLTNLTILTKLTNYQS